MGGVVGDALRKQEVYIVFVRIGNLKLHASLRRRGKHRTSCTRRGMHRVAVKNV